jgi:hypothetical protein
MLRQVFLRLRCQTVEVERPLQPLLIARYHVGDPSSEEINIEQYW